MEKYKLNLGIVALADWLDEELLASGIKNIESYGANVKVSPQCYKKNGRFAGKPKDRACGLHSLMVDDEVDIILCARGGYGSVQLVDYLDMNIIKDNFKPLVGYSDNTYIMNLFSSLLGTTNYHGPMVVDFAKNESPSSLENLFKAISLENHDILDSFSMDRVSVIKEGKASGKLIGGNLSVITSMLGTIYDPIEDGCILFIEEVFEMYFRLDRMLKHLKYSGVLEKISGLVIGDLFNMQDSNIPYGMSIEEIIFDNVKDLGIPVISNVSAGHARHKITLPLGSTIELDANIRQVSLKLT